MIKLNLGIMVLIAIMLFCVLFMVEIAFGGEWSNEQIVNAIYKAENSVKYPYGIKSIDTKGDEVYARKICFNTVRNQRVRHANHECGLDFITCLGKRYCPVGGELDDGRCKYWERNVKFFLRAIQRGETWVKR